MNQTPLLYFAYGSNQNKRRAARRIPGAVDLGVAVLPNYRLTERLYADIDFCEGAEVFGVLYLSGLNTLTLSTARKAIRTPTNDTGSKSSSTANATPR